MKNNIYWFILLLWLASCQSLSKENNIEATPYLLPKYAKRFIISKIEDCFVVNVYRKVGQQQDTMTYYLLPKQSSIPAQLSQKSIIRTPVTHLGCMSTTYLPFLALLDVITEVKGVAGTEYICTDSWRDRVARGEIQSLGSAEEPDKERIVALHPDLLLASTPPETDKLTTLLDQENINCLYLAEWLEQHPLARTEWVRLIGLLFDKQHLADSIFDEIEQSYLKEVANAKQFDKSPTVMVGLSWQGNWFVAGGKSYVAQLINDANAVYLFADNDSEGSVQISFEKIYTAGQQANFWINTDAATTRNELLAAEPRCKDLKPFLENKVFNNNKKRNQQGWNEYYETSVVQPHLVLHDLVNIFHYSADSLYYYTHLK
jgi:iron complex transport system substrate-binding protein